MESANCVIWEQQLIRQLDRPHVHAGQISGLRPSHTHTQQTKRVENPAVHIDYLPTHSAPFVRKDLSPFIPPWVASRTTPWTRAAADRWRSASRLACVLAQEKDLCLACMLAQGKGLVPSLCTSPLEMHYRPLGPNGAEDGGQLSAPLAATV